ncbi:MAG: glycosyltransferase family 39 protein [Candidatus Omnitrophica bacterium]|nr:glycosyltransferase family 39 protein [Candidatus Omnitrophota bacterium]
MNRGFFYDELFLVNHGLLSPEVFRSYFLEDYSTANHIGYTVLSFGVCHFLGIKEWTVRLPALIFGLGSVVVFWFWLKEYFGRWTAFLGTLLMTLSPVCVIWSASGRGYSAFIFFTILSTSLYFRLLEYPSKKKALSLGVVNTIGIAFHLFFLPVIFAQLCHVIVLSLQKRILHKPRMEHQSLIYGFFSVLVSFLLSACVYIPIAGKYVFSQSGIKGEFISNFPLMVLTDFLSLALIPLGVVCLILMIIGLMKANVRLAGWRVYVLFLFLIPIPFWLANPQFLSTRFFAFLIPFIFLGVANGMSVLPRLIPEKFPKVFKILCVVGVFVTLCSIGWSWKTKPSDIVEEYQNTYKESVTFAKENFNGTANFCSIGLGDKFFQFYSDRPMRSFSTFGDFIALYSQGKEMVCFALMGPPMSDEHKKIFLFMWNNAQIKTFNKIYLFYLKGKS